MDKRRITDAEREATRWIARLEADDVTLEDHQRFRAWLEASPENRIAHDSVSRTWDKLDALKVLGAELRAPAVRSVSRRWLLAGGTAVGAVAAVAAGVWIATPATTFAATYETPVGGRELATMQDGSEIELNAMTSVAATYTSRARNVTLQRGEALFNVVSDDRPFRINTAFGSINAASPGSYLVKALVDGVRVSVITGRIDTRSVRTPLRAGTEAQLSSGSTAIDELPPEGAARRLAWRDHMLALDGETLAEAAAEVERQTGARFVIDDPSLRELALGGYIDTRDEAAFLSLLDTNLGIDAVQRADGSVALARR